METIIWMVVLTAVGWLVGFACGKSSSPVLPVPVSSNLESTYSPWEKENLYIEIRRLRHDLESARAEVRYHQSLNYAWNHCCPRCYGEHTHVVYAKSHKEQEVVDLLKKTIQPLDELKQKFGI